MSGRRFRVSRRGLALILLPALSAVAARAADAPVPPKAAMPSPAPRPEDFIFEDYHGIGVRGGVAIPIGGMRGPTGSLASFEYLRSYNPTYGLLIGVDYMRFGYDPEVREPNLPTGGLRRDVSALMSLRYSPVQWRLARPILVAGVGMHYWDAVHEHTKDSKLDSIDSTRKHRSFGWKPAAAVGGGFFGRVGDTMLWDISARWHYLPEPREFRVNRDRPGQALTLGALVGIEI